MTKYKSQKCMGPRTKDKYVKQYALEYCPPAAKPKKY